MVVKVPVRLRKKTNSAPPASGQRLTTGIVIGALEDAGEYNACSKQSLLRGYDVQSAVERQLTATSHLTDLRDAKSNARVAVGTSARSSSRNTIAATNTLKVSTAHGVPVIAAGGSQRVIACTGGECEDGQGRVLSCPAMGSRRRRSRKALALPSTDYEGRAPSLRGRCPSAPCRIRGWRGLAAQALRRSR